MKVLVTCATIIFLQFLSTIQGEDELWRDSRAFDPEYGCLWHYKFRNFTSPQLKAAYYDNKLKVCYRDPALVFSPYFYSCIDSTDFFQFTDPVEMRFAKEAHLDGLIYDDSNASGTKSTSLSLRNAYPALIAITQRDAYSSVDDNQSWLKTCEDCVKSSITDVNSEIYKSADGTFWASYNDNNRIITSRDMRTWTYHSNLEPGVIIHNIFPIKTDTGEDKWVLVQVVNNVVNYYYYYVGTMTHEDGYINERGPYNLTYGPDDIELFFANKGDTVDASQIMLPTLINTYIGFQGDITNLVYVLLRAPIILATPRNVMFKNIRGTPRLVQVAAVQASTVPRKYQYTFSRVEIQEGIVNPLNSIRSTSFIMNMAFSLQDSKEVGVHVRRSTDGAQRTQIGYLVGDTFYVDRFRSGVPRGMPLANQGKYKRRFDAREPVDRTNIRFIIYADGPLLEVYCDEGQVNFNLLIFPQATSDRMEIITSRAPALLISLVIVTYDE